MTGSKLAATVTAGTLSAIGTTQHPQYASFTSEAKVARTVMVKIQVIYIGREDASSGYLSYDEKTETAYGGTLMGDQHSNAVVQVRAAEGLTAVLTYSQEPRWEAPTTSTYMSNTFPVAAFFASGLPASAVVYRVRVQRFVEYLPFDGAISEGAMVAEPYNPAALAVHSMLAGPGASIGSGSTPEPPLLKQLANAAYHMAAPMKDWAVKEARQFLQDNMGALATGGLAMLTL